MNHIYLVHGVYDDYTIDGKIRPAEVCQTFATYEKALKFMAYVCNHERKTNMEYPYKILSLIRIEV